MPSEKSKPKEEDNCADALERVQLALKLVEAKMKYIKKSESKYSKLKENP